MGKEKTEEGELEEELLAKVPAEPAAEDWGRKSIVTLALTILTSSQGLLIAASKAKDVKYDYSVTSANCTVEIVKMILSLIALTKVRRCRLNRSNPS